LRQFGAMLRILVLLSLFSLTACGHRAARSENHTRNLAVATVSAPHFSDADPHPWDRHAPQKLPVHGVDLSKFQTSVDWDAARAGGVNFAFIKATEGGDQVDPMFGTHWAAAGRAGVHRGAYHFFYHCRPAIEQARWFINHVPRVSGALPPVLDMEWTPTSPTCTIRRDGATIRDEARVFLDALQAHYGQRPIVYTSVDFYRDNDLGKLRGTEFWLRSVAAHPAEIYAGQPWVFWQYSSTGIVPGVAGRADINAFAGSAASWQDWLSRRSQ
jgi:lysozyme